VQKIRLINTSDRAHRVHILPPSTKVFSIKMKKKGNLAPGMHQNIFIHFKPKEHKYYYDSLRVHTESQNLVIPIHAFPVISREHKTIFPRLIDFGTIEIGETQTMKFPIIC